MTKRPDGRYMIQVDVGRDPVTGKRVRKTVYGKTKKEVEEKKRQIMLELSNGMNLRVKMPTVSEWIDRYLDTYCRTDTETMRDLHRHAADRVKSYFKTMPLNEVKKSDVVLFAATLSGFGLTVVSVARSLLENAMQAAVDDGLLLRNPAVGVKYAHAEAGTHRELTEDEIRTINKVWSAQREGLGTLVMLYCGLRIGEYLALQWKHVDLDRAVIHVEHSMKYRDGRTIIGSTKTPSSVRAVPIPPPLLRILRFYAADPDHFLHNEDGSMLGIQCAMRRFAQYWSAYGLSIRAHDLRHTYATMLYEAGVDIKAAQALLGHAKPDMTLEIYTHLTEKKSAESIGKLNRYLDNSYSITTVQSV